MDFAYPNKEAQVALSAVELERGWVEFKCPDHGFLVATIPTAFVKCRCGKAAAPFRHGRRLKSGDIKALQNVRSKITVSALRPYKGAT